MLRWWTPAGGDCEFSFVALCVIVKALIDRRQGPISRHRERFPASRAALSGSPATRQWPFDQPPRTPSPWMLPPGPPRDCLAAKSGNEWGHFIALCAAFTLFRVAEWTGFSAHLRGSESRPSSFRNRKKIDCDFLA
jgi:hypothetical protein